MLPLRPEKRRNVLVKSWAIGQSTRKAEMKRIESPPSPEAAVAVAASVRRTRLGSGRTWALALATVALGSSLLAFGSPAQAATATHSATANTSYRHGLLPMLGKSAKPLVTCSSKCVKFQGGISGVGVTTGKEKVYLVFWGTQWGTQGTNGQGYATFTGDSKAMAPYLQTFFSGLGSSTDKWSGVMTQYCQGVTKGSTTCTQAAAHVAYPTGGALAGVWEDTSGASPAQSTAQQLATEAGAAATHFGNTTQASNRDDQYVIISPTGTNPDNYKGNGFCAWHDYTGDGYSVPGPLVAFTNLPYVTDVGASCGADFVNPGGTLDGVSIVEGHEYAETITDQFPAGGWINTGGAEVGDLCAWVTSGKGRVQNITLSTGTFAVQGIWSNASAKGAGACAIKHSIVT